MPPALPANATPEDIVYRFLHALAAQEHDQVAALLAPELRYTNVSLPTLRGGEFVARLLRRVISGRRRFDVQVHSIAASGDTVLTERTDVLALGPLHVRFWVCGTFRVENGRITLWRDYFDWWDLGRGTVRGVLGIALPRLRATLPAQPGE
jgi:limonene-1,2-epoxide hydrolase